MAAETKQHSSVPATLRKLRSSPTFILLTVSVAMFNDVFLFGTIIPALPYALPHRVDINPDDVQIWIAALLAAYGGALFIGALFFGWLGDRLPRRRDIFLFGIACLLSATLLIAIGRHMAFLLIGRFFQGLAAAIVWTNGLALLTDNFGKERYGEAVGYCQTSVSLGTTSAPLLGGIAYARAGFKAVSRMSLGVVAFSLILALLMLEPKAQSEDRAPDMTKGYTNGPGGETEDIVGTTAIPPISDVPDEQSTLIPKISKADPDRARMAYPLLIRSGRILAAMGGIFTYAFVIISFEGIIPLFVKDTFHWTSEHAALTFLAWIIPGFLGPVAGKTSDRFGSRWVAIAGFAVAIVPLVLMRLVTQDTMGQKVLLCVLLTLVGFGVVWILPACLSDLTAAADELKAERPQDFGSAGTMTQAFGLNLVAYSCGTFLGPTAAGIIKAKLNWGAATVVLAGACATACVPIVSLAGFAQERHKADSRVVAA